MINQLAERFASLTSTIAYESVTYLFFEAIKAYRDEQTKRTSDDVLMAVEFAAVMLLDGALRGHAADCIRHTIVDLFQDVEGLEAFAIGGNLIGEESAATRAVLLEAAK